VCFPPAGDQLIWFFEGGDDRRIDPAKTVPRKLSQSQLPRGHGWDLSREPAAGAHLENGSIVSITRGGSR
jgi:hypothetical protein